MQRAGESPAPFGVLKARCMMIFRLRPRTGGAHVHVSVFGGETESSLKLLGSVVVDTNEFVELRRRLEDGEVTQPEIREPQAWGHVRSRAGDVFTPRRFVPLSADHPALGATCPLCAKPFGPGDETSFVPTDVPPSNQCWPVKASLVHWACVGRRR